MCLLQSWYGLSDYEVEDRINDSLSFSYFCGLTIEQTTPDHSTLPRFRIAMIKTNAYEKLFKAINKQLEKKETTIIQIVLHEILSSKSYETLFISSHTVVAHKKNIFKKPQVKSIASLIKRAIYLG